MAVECRVSGVGAQTYEESQNQIHTHFLAMIWKNNAHHQSVGAPTYTLQQAKQKPTPNYTLNITREHIGYLKF